MKSKRPRAKSERKQTLWQCAHAAGERASPCVKSMEGPVGEVHGEARGSGVWIGSVVVMNSHRAGGKLPCMYNSRRNTHQPSEKRRT